LGQKIGFAGYIISNTGVYPDPARPLAIRQFPVPTDLSSLRGLFPWTSKSVRTLPARSGTYDSQFKTTIKKGREFSVVTSTTSGRF
jgi:hypothetical protein